MSRYKMSRIIPLDDARKMTLQEGMEKTGLTEAQLKQYLQTFQRYFPRESLWINEQTFSLPKLAKQHFPDFLFQPQEEAAYFDEKERIMLIYLLTFSRYKELSVFHYQSFLNVSKNTILSDIKNLRRELAAYEVKLEYGRKEGFFLSGDEWTIRRLGFHWINKLVETTVGTWQLSKWIHAHDFNRYTTIRTQIETAMDNKAINMIPGRLEGFYGYMCLIIERMAESPLSIEEEHYLGRVMSTHIHQIAEDLLASTGLSESICQKEAAFITILLLTLTQGQIEEPAFDFLLHCASQMIQELERRSAIQFEDYRKLLLDVFNHLVPAYFRIYYDLEIEQPFLTTIERDYPEISAITEAALSPLEKLVGKPISKGEKAYFTLLFGAAIKNQQEKEKTEQLHALIVCPNGISTSMIMEAELKRLFPTIIFHTHYALSEMERVSLDSYDLIFSSVAFDSAKPLFLIRPIMEQTEKNHLVKKVQEQFLIPGVLLVTPEEVLQSILPYLQLKEGVTSEKLLKILSRKMMRTMNKKEDRRPMLTELLTKPFIQFEQDELDWEAAIHKAAEPLETEYINADYVEAMIQKVKDYGAFINIGKGIALPHARPEDGVKKLGMSMLKVAKPVLLLDDPDHPISIFICLAAVDNESHLRALASLTKLLSDKASLEKLLAAKDANEIIQIMKEKEGEEK